MLSRRIILVSGLSAGVLALASASWFNFGGVKKPPAPSYPKEIKPLLAQYCYPCHGEKQKGGIDFRKFQTEDSVEQERQLFARVLKQVQAHEMPPEGKPRPSEVQYDHLARWIESVIFKCDCKNPDPGRVTIRRLNRTEYNNTIRDLLGVDFQPAEDFPADDIGYGFDNIGDVLSLPPVLFEKYLAAADRILAAAMLDGPIQAGSTNRVPAFHQRMFARAAATPDKALLARQIIADFARRAYRRPVKAEEIARLVQLVEQAQKAGDNFEQSLKVAFKAILISPHFLFRGELQADPDNPKAIRPLDNYALATRLSYFLWSTMPDEALFAEAGQGTLRKNLEPQVRRMLRDPKAAALVKNFATQWLQLAKLTQVTPDQSVFPDYDASLREAMLRETELFFEGILREDRSVLEFLDADYTYLNDQLARHYHIFGITGSQFRKVSLKGTPRGGLLTQASILTLTSNPTRTSPVKRGKWVLDNLLGAPPPPPPPNVPELKETGELTGTLRQRMEQHRADPMCASCHSRMDPIGFGLENFNAVGGWRVRDGKDALDTSGKLVSGESFAGHQQLKAILLKQKRDDFIRCLTEKMLVYALGRGLEYYDRCAVEEIAESLAKNRYHFSTLILGVAKSAPFQNRRGEAAVADK